MEKPYKIAIIGGGPAGLMAAEALAAQLGATASIEIFERKATFARKFLMAGRGGLNLTHSEDIQNFLPRYGAAQGFLAPLIARFSQENLRDWSAGFGQDTFVGSSGRVFPKAMKASPLLRAWRVRLDSMGVTQHTQHDWQGWNDSGELVFAREDGSVATVAADAVLLALGGASWPRLGSDGSWAGVLSKRGVALTPFAPANCGFTVAWSDHFRGKFAGQPLKSIALSFEGIAVQGEAVISQSGIEGGAVYALSARLRDRLAAHGAAALTIDLKPGVTVEALAQKLGQRNAAKSFSTYLRSAVNMSAVSVALFQEAVGRDAARQLEGAALAAHIKSLPLKITGVQPMERAISTAGGIALEELDGNMMLKRLPGVFAAGEMLDWEAPTGGYLLQATFATGVAAADGMARWLKSRG